MDWSNIQKAGTCYETALTYILDENIKTGNEDLILVHADVIGTGGDVKGATYCHAFVLDGDNAIDTEANVTLPYKVYKAVGNVTNEKRYTFDEMLREALESGHYGPW